MKQDLIYHIVNSDEEIFKPIKESNLPVILFGAGGQASLVLSLLRDKGIQPTCFCDNNSQLWGSKYLNLDVCSYDDVKESFGEYIIIISVKPNRGNDIVEQLRQRGEKNPYYNVCIPFKVDHKLLMYKDVINKITAYQEIYSMLEDDESREIFIDMMNYRLTGDGTKLLKSISGNTFFDDALLNKEFGHSYVDVGAYTGDTIMKFCQFNGDRYKRIVGIELEKGNFESLQRFINYSRLENVELHNVGGWSQKGKMKCYTFSNLGFENANLFTGADVVANINKRNDVQRNNEEAIEIEMDVDSVDNLLRGAEASLIKINAISADLEILKGCKKTISSFKPSLVLEYGCMPEHLYEIPMFIKSAEPSYKIYLRQKSIFKDSKTILYAR